MYYNRQLFSWFETFSVLSTLERSNWWLLQVARQEAEAAQQRMAVAQQLVTAAQSPDTAMQAAADLPRLSSIM